MAEPVKDSFGDLERHRARLEENVEKLRKSLQHWQTWEAEYEGLKEEILAFNGEPSREQFLAIGNDFGGDLVNEQEIKALLGDDKGIVRTKRQVVDLVGRRIDYVQQNVKSVEKQLHTAEEKVDAVMVLYQPEVMNEDGLPVTEIREELDEEGNVISSSTSRASDTAPQVLEALRKAGVDIPSGKPSNEPQSEGSSKMAPKEPSGEKTQKPDTDAAQPVQPQSEAKKTSGKPAKKSVSFAENVEEKPTEKPTSAPTQKLNFAQLRPDQRIIEINDSDDDDEDERDPPVIPENESSEDAQLRREMLEYGLNEVGSVVAELDLDESGSQFSDGDDYDEYGEDEEDEDKYGRSTRREISDDYRQEMLELEKQLNARMMQNAGPGGEIPPDLRATGAAQFHIKDEEVEDVSEKPKQKSEEGKKGVRFAEALDIAPPSKPVAKEPPAPVSVDKDAPPAIQDSIIERKAPATSAPGPAAPAPRRVSKFKSARQAADTSPASSKETPQPTKVANGPLANGIVERNNRSSGSSLPLFPASGSKPKQFMGPIKMADEERTRKVPEGPSGKTLANAVVENDPSALAPPFDPDEFDPALLEHQVAVEYHKMRNRMVQRQGGFLPQDEEEEIVPLAPEEGGSGEKKMSRFKAARLAKLGQS
ncbi:hypothetical protein L228DRAFT_235257 [Xylona heveae TC161]|uniref:DUF3835 domain-containing protein n=1 Tax=Xylona heveae (strain CBS 132557 / TC161) TaxID=1328760 RepID=A0A165JF01_XYLHT|nr:hypothetical protein L228DRAFT_235257 [Xylona heveae TC161]KZF26150.1 hypothetical protein L228DRAFT_235257 [Xylona heveae TC161]